ncbi:MAG: type II toxin-antitoxin system RelE/ParE family toxin [Candidatus Sungbacteria bacterium]|nr:type II toxin-antitoxin system RelE/ParE family toxin [Candidatus Sungbacteria bacterium]
MDKIEKALQKFSAWERVVVKQLLEKLQSGSIASLNIKKLKGREDIFRVRKGDIRIIYRLDKKMGIFVLAIERRKENTYKL